MTKRFQRLRRKINVTKRDLAIIQAVFDARYLTGRMVRQLFYTPTTASACRQRLRYLFDAGFLRKRRAYPNEPDIYFLGLRGRRYIASLGAYARTDVDRIAGVPGTGRAPMLMMQHELTLSGLYVNAKLECRRYGWRLGWWNTRMLELARIGMEPDGYLHVEGPTSAREAFIEFTAVPPDHYELERKLQRYTAFWESHRGVIVLWLAASRHGLRGLQAAIGRHVYRDWFLLSLIDEARDFLTQPIWWHAERGEGVRFITPNGEPAIK